MTSNKKSISGIICLVLMMAFTTTFAQLKNEVNLKGTLKNNTYTSLTLYQIGKDPTKIATIPVDQEGHFAYTLTLNVTDFYKLEFDKSNFIMLILQAGENVEIANDGNSLNNLVVSGSKQTSQVIRNQTLIAYTKAKLDSISNLSTQNLTNPKYDSLLKIYSSEYEKVNSLRKNILTDFVSNNKSSLAILFLPEVLKLDDNLDLYSKADSVLFKKYPTNFYVQSFHGQIEASKQKIIAAKLTSVGVLAPDFTLPDTCNKKVSLSSFKGKYLLIDFWASWCGPCMRELPNVQKIYADFSKKGFDILGVSLDKDRKSWVNAIITKGLPWTQVSDLKYWQSMVVPLYAVEAIPLTVLLDKEGRIIAKNLRGEELYKKVESLVK